VRHVCGHLTERSQPLGLSERFAERQHATIAFLDFRVALTELGGRIAHALLQCLVEMFHAGEHLVEAFGDRTQLVAACHARTRAEVPSGDAVHRVSN
jgi:hypothetical protein